MADHDKIEAAENALLDAIVSNAPSASNAQVRDLAEALALVRDGGEFDADDDAEDEADDPMNATVSRPRSRRLNRP